MRWRDCYYIFDEE